MSDNHHEASLKANKAFADDLWEKALDRYQSGQVSLDCLKEAMRHCNEAEWKLWDYLCRRLVIKWGECAFVRPSPN